MRKTLEPERDRLMLELQQLRVAAFTKYQDFEALKQERDKNAADLAAAVKERDTLSKCLLAIESDLSDKVEKIAALESICDEHEARAGGVSDESSHMCARPGCAFPVCVEDGRRHDYCSRTCARQAGVVLQDLLDVDGASKRVWKLQGAITNVVTKHGEFNLKLHMENLREVFHDFERALVGNDNTVLVSESWSLSIDPSGRVTDDNINIEIAPSLLSKIITPRLSGLAQILKSTPFGVFYIVNLLGH